MSSSEESSSLLFLDTFSHDNSEDLNLDLVQFSKAVIVQEVIVIPSGCKVIADIPGSFRIGSTIPSSFRLEFYVNNLEKRNSTFEKVGLLEYNENVDIVLKSENRVPTDGLIIKGWYQTITLAVYGMVTSVNQDNSPPPPPPTSQRSKLQSVLPVGSNHKTVQEKFDLSSKHFVPSLDSKSLTNLSEGFNPKDIPLEHRGAAKDPREKEGLYDNSDAQNSKLSDKNDILEGSTKLVKSDNSELSKEDQIGKNTSRKRQRSGRPADSPEKKRKEMSPNPFFDEDVIEPGEIPEAGDIAEENVDIYGTLSDGEIPDGDGDYSQVSSEENHISFTNCLPQDTGDLGEWENTEDGAWSYSTLGSFNPYQCDLAPLETFPDPSLTPYEDVKQKITNGQNLDDLDVSAASAQLLKIVDLFKNSKHTENWVEAMESIPTLLNGLAYLVEKSNNKEILEVLIDWTFEGLDVKKMVQQQESSYKLRYMKAGIRMAGCLCACTANIATRMLERNVQQKLLDMFTSNHMSTPLKLLILFSLDQTIRFKVGIDFFLGKHETQAKGKNVENGDMNHQHSNDVEMIKYSQTPYQRTIEIFNMKHNSQPITGLKALLRKCHLYEVLLKLSTFIENLIQKVPFPEASSKSEVANIAAAGSNNSMVRFEVGLDIDPIVQCLDEIYRVLSQADALISQPVRAFVKTVKFDIRPPVSPLPCLYHFFNSCHLLEGIFVLLTSPATCNNSNIFAAVRNIFSFLLSCQSGLLFLNFRIDTINGILRALTQSTDFNSEEERELSPANQLGLTMVYYLQTIQHIDQLNEYHTRSLSFGNGEANDAAILAVLLNLNSITFTQQGREALVNVFVLDDNIAALLRFIEITGEEEIRSQQPVCFAYALTIVLVITRYSDKVEWLEKFGHRILNVVEIGIKNGKSDERVRELQEWLSPLKHLTSFSYDSSTVSELVTLLRQYTEEIIESPKPMITVLRILKHLSVAPEIKHDGENVELLKYQWVLAELFSSNCLPLFTNMLQKVKEMLMLSWQQGFPPPASERSLVLSLVQPILYLMKCLLSILILSCGTEFKDLGAVPSLLSLHTVLCSVSPTGVLPTDLQCIQNIIVDTLMAFTQPPLSPENSEEVVGRSLWSMMVKEVLKYTLTAPYTFLSGLVLLSEMLPLPLPIQSKESLVKGDIKQVVLCRKKWSAHLQPHHSEINEIIGNLAGTACQPLIQLLRRTCWQLADLSAPTALFIVRSLLDTLLESMDYSIDPAIKSFEPASSDLNNTVAVPPAPSTVSSTPTEENAGADKPNIIPEEVPASSRTARILNLLSFLTNQPVVKAAFFSLTRNELRIDEKYIYALPRLCTLLNLVSDEPPHVQSQEAIVAIFQSLCDAEISLITQENSSNPLELLSNGLPTKEQLRLVCNSLLHHINNRDQKFSSVLPSLRTLTLLMDHDYGFYFVKQAMEQVPTAFFNLFMQINATFSKDSSDCIATLSSAAECIQFLVIPSSSYPPNSDNRMIVFPENEAFGTSPALRTYRMTFKEVREILGWSSTENVLAHPLHDLDVLLCEYAKDEETLKAVYDCVHAVLGILKSEEDQASGKEVVELDLLSSMKFRDQFLRRVIYNTIEEEDDRLTSAYWLSTPMGDESDQEQDSEKGDLIEMASLYCPGFDLESELKKGSTSSEASLLPRFKSKFLTKKHGDTINTSKMKGAGNFVAPLRGRGFIRGGSGGLGRGDVFRSRPPNTSRPPSMHVDDFVKLETQNHQQPAPDIIPVSITTPRRPEDIMRGGHTFDRGGTRFVANRWQLIPAPFTHRDDSVLMRGPYRGLSMVAGRGIMRGTATGSPTKIMPWIFRRASYGSFGRGENSLQDPIERLERRGGGYPYVHNASTIGWQEHKDREQDQRFVGMPIESFSMWRDRTHHQRTSNR